MLEQQDHKNEDEKVADDTASQPEDVSYRYSASRLYSGSRRYSDAVTSHSKRSKEAYLHSGLHYDALARFLGSESNGNKLYDRAPIPHVVVKTITKDGLETSGYNSHSEHVDFSLPNPGEAGKAYLVFLRGYTSPSWLNRICEQTNIRPEYFRRHLNFIDKKEFFDLPSLPSGSKEILRLRITTICTRSVPLTSAEIEKSHKQEEEYIVKHQREMTASGRAGDSIIRRYAVHNETTFTLGQDISCFIKQRKHGWAGLIWLDVGRDLYEKPPWPWFAKGAHSLSGNHTCLPVIQHRPKVANPDAARDADSRISVNGPRLGQSAGLLPLQYGGSLDRPAMLCDAMYALSDIVAFAAASEKQFLNMIGAQIERDLRLYLDNMEASSTQISHSKIVLDEHLRSSLETLTCLRSGGGPHWPRATEDKLDAQRKLRTVDDSLSDLVLDYESLVSETESLVRRCVEGSDLITNKAMLDESRKAGEQNSRIGRLTTLAFFFVPNSFVASFFGMNFKEFGQGSLRIWVGIVVMVVFIIASAAVCFSDQLSKWWKGIAEHLRLFASGRDR